MSEEIASQFPHSVVITNEFDMQRRGCEELARKLQRNNRLVDYICYPGIDHGYNYQMSRSMGANYYEDMS